MNDFRPNNFRVVDTFRKGRIFVAGGLLRPCSAGLVLTRGFCLSDAAHVHSATGGQGLNSSVMDSVSYHISDRASIVGSPIA